MPHKQVALGLDLRGGSYLLLEVDVAAAQRERLNSIVDNVRNALRDAKIGYTGLNVEGDAIAFTIRDPDRIEDARQALRKIDPDLTVEIAADGVRDDALQHGRDRGPPPPGGRPVDRDHPPAHRRDRHQGADDPARGPDRILVQLPGVDNPEHVKALLGRTAKLTFQLVDTSVSRRGRATRPAAAGRRDPAGRGRAGGMSGAPAYVVRKRVMVGGDTLVDAQPTFQNNEPVVSFQFDAAGAKRFGDATRENVGKPFAIVLDNKVISAPVIREPILGGSGIISGSFTVQSASDLALLLRAGALPAPITILEERTVGAELGADSIHAGAVASIVGVVLVIVFMMLFYGLFGVFADIALIFNLCLMLGSAVAARRDPDPARHRRDRADDGHGGRRQRPDLRAHPRGGARRPHDAVLARSRVQPRLRHDPRQPHDDLGRRAPALLAGSGPVKGFAVTLSIGVLTSLFSAILVTRLQIVTWLRRWKPREIPL